MPNNAFTAADALSSAAVSLVMGEQMKLLPWLPASGVYSRSSIADPNRDPVEFRGVFGGAPGQGKLGGDRAGNDIEGLAATRSLGISADFRDWPAYATKGDRIQLLEQPTLPMMEIERIDNDGLNRVSVNLVRIE